jgi:TonB-linked SusC/RagA family outer membrane protein
MPLNDCCKTFLPERRSSFACRSVQRKRYATSFLLVLVLGFALSSAAQKVTLRENNASLEKVLSAIYKQTGYAVVYQDQVIKKAVPVTIEVSNLSFKETLDKIFAMQPRLMYEIVGNKIISVKEKKAAVKVWVKGLVKHENGAALEGIAVKTRNSKKNTVTNNRGEFELGDMNEGEVLTFSGVGFETKEVAVGNEARLDVTLQVKVNVLDEVVITALGIRREEKALGYAVTKVSGENLTNALSNNWTEALSGKVAGLNLMRTNGGPAGSSKIVIRGESSLAGNSEALIVVDGVVISSSSGRRTGNGNGAYQGDDAAVDFGSSLSDINPEDIETVTVLKGPGATALYGARGAGGAILVTTKQGRPKQKGIGVSFSSNTAFEKTSTSPDYQNEYGQGDGGQNYYSYGNTVDGTTTKGPSAAWGPRFNGQSFFQYDPVTRTTGATRTPWVPYKNNRDDFFVTGRTLTNSVSIDGGSGKTTARLSFTNLNNQWIIPNTGYKRNTVALSVNQKVTDKFTLSSRINFINRSSDNLPSTGYNNQTIMYWMMYQAPNIDLNWYKPYWVPGQEGVLQNHPFSGNLDNPYLIAYEMLNKQDRNSLIANVQASYDFTPDLNLMLRTSIDMSNEARSQQRPKNTAKYQDGMYRTQNTFSQEITNDFMLKYSRTVKKFSLSGSVGGSMMKNRYNLNELRANRLLYPGIFNFSNSKDVPVAYPYKSEFAVNGLYTFLTASYDNFLFLDASGRNDWSSTLATPYSTDNVSFFYPSVNASAVLSQKMRLPVFVSFLKLRASWAQVGNGGTIPYLTSYTYVSEPTFPSGLSNPNTIANPNLQSELSTNIEFGTNIRLFNSRVNLDVSYYRNNTSKQIISAPVDRSTGYYYVVLNSGVVRNQGLEVEAKASVLKSKKGLNWDITGTYYTNKNKVLSLADSVETIVLQTGPGNRGSIEARIGGNMADLYGIGFQRSPDGQIVYNNGYPVLSQTAKYLGRITPAWKASVGNEFTYKNFRFNILFDGQFGGKAYSLTNAIGMENGKLAATLPGRYNGLIGKGVKMVDGKYVPNDIIAENIWTYYGQYGRENLEANVFRTDFIKLREARIDYRFPAKFTGKLHLQGAKIGIYGRDLFIFSHWPAYDPEFATLGNGSISGGFEIGQFPSTRTMGVSLNITF